MNSTKLLKILYAEDEPDLQTLVGMVLKMKGGFEVKICSSGNEAIQIAPDFKPDLFLLDVMMPGKDGPSTLKSLRELPEFQKTPAIFITAKSNAKDLIDFKDKGAIDVITKPFDPLELPVLISRIWDKYYERK